ncbi:MAG TPA: response regulator transcription factor [Candidatus Kapabacteria bacterium]|nr:response regulator transcription factor [Candidatus Kapabacteria bacterium]
MNTLEKIRVVVADDHDMVRAGIRGWLEMEPDLLVVGEARNGEEAVRLVHTLKPDVLVQDIQMPGMNGLSVIRTLREEGSPTRVLAITGFDNSSVRSALESGACGYLTKEEKREVMVEAVRWAAARTKGIWISPAVAADLTQANMAVAEAALTKAEINLLGLLALSNGDIARRLHISESTVKNHITSIYSKLNVRTRREAMEWARRHGLMDAVREQ